MNILYISYWGVNDPLTQSTIFPYLNIIKDSSKIDKIFLVTVEREHLEKGTKLVKSLNDLDYIIHCPMNANNAYSTILSKMLDFIQIPYKTSKIVWNNNIKLILARGVMAGALGYKISKRCEIPFYVESFEPHAEYMVESGVWKRNGLKYIMQKRWEKKQIKHSEKLITVSNNYKYHLVNDLGIASNKVEVIPCCTDQKKFKFNEIDRKTLRDKLDISDFELCGIYVGKFGGIYYEEEAFEIFKRAFDFFGKRFRLVLLTPNNSQEIQENLTRFNIDRTKVQILFVPHNDVPKYLSASDFAFSTIKFAKSRRYCSPVKDGEYWTNGLPILLTSGVGDDSDIIQEESGGALFDLKKNNIDLALGKIEEIIGNRNYREKISEIAKRHRPYSIANEVYSRIL